MGAISSLGKTTFVHQMADQLAQAGEHVLYFSLEQTSLELVTKGISRLTAQADINTVVSSIDIRRRVKYCGSNESARGIRGAVRK